MTFALGVAVAVPATATKLTAEVDPFIGTGGTGHTYPGATTPFGMVQVSPDTRLDGWEGCSGYWYPEKYIYGFSHTHLSGTGVGDYCDILLMPGVGEVRFDNGAGGKPGYRSAFHHEEEWATPGYYAVHLLDSDVRVELTATPRTGLHLYTFPGDGAGHVLLDLVHRDEVLDSSVRIVSDREVRGFRRSRGWAQDQRVYFALRFSRPLVSHVIQQDGVRSADITAAAGKAIRAAFEFGRGAPLRVQVALSAVDEAGAVRNLQAEEAGAGFEAARRRAEQSWEKELGRIRIDGGTPTQRRVFYTALYHAFLQPNLYSDVDGRYRGRDLQIHHADAGNQYTVFSLWDTFRAAHPLYTLLLWDRTRDFARTFLRQYQEGGLLPVWELAANETNCMIGYHAVPVLAEAILKGIPGIDAEKAFEAMCTSAAQDRRGLDAYRRHGFIPADEEGESVSQTLEYAYDDACIARVAAKLGKDAGEREFLRRARAYRHLYDPATGFMRARLHGHWFDPFDPAEVNFHYTEANAWQYTFCVPQDVGGLIRLHGGERRFAAQLDSLFATQSQLHGTQQADITGLIGLYAQGNEPSHHMAYLYAYAGQPWKTQALVRRIADDMYRDGPEGLPGNEDCGQMSAWYVWSALGLYPVDPASGDYILGSPRFPRATLQLGNGRRLVIRATPNVATDPYVQAVRFDNERLDRVSVTWDELIAGGELAFTMGPGPAAAPTSRPPERLPPSDVLPAPFVAQGARLFTGSTTVTLGCADAAAAIHYTIDGSVPILASPVFETAVQVDRTTTIRAVAVHDAARSPVIDLSFFRKIPGRHVELHAHYTPRYGAGGDDALIDGLRGKANFRLGAWQGFQGQDLEARVDLGAAPELQRLTLGCLQDTRSWILLPLAVDFAVSTDGVHYESVGTATHDVPDRNLDVLVRDLQVSFPPRRARFVRIRVHSYGPLPAWHPGAGSPSFIFVDELVAE